MAEKQRNVTKSLRRKLGNNNFVTDFATDTESAKPEIQSFFDGIDSQKYKVFVSTWNVGGIEPDDDLNLEDWLDTYNSCDIYVLGFQEIVPLGAWNILGSENTKISMKWNSLISKCLNNKKQNFNCIISKKMVGIFLSIWIRFDLLSFVQNPNISCVGCGIMGYLGNKGSISAQFKVHETTFCFVCTHLASGSKEGDEKNRNSDAMEILSRTNFLTRNSSDMPRKILDHDRVIFFGDLNYRISLPVATIQVLANQREWNSLLENDQLKMELMNGQIFQGWHEGIIKFGPTYKYFLNSDVYYGSSDHAQKVDKRSPAWCDRIIWYGTGIKQNLYTRGESKLSDHRPVKAMFTVEIEKSTNFKDSQGLILSSTDDFLCKEGSIFNFEKILGL